ncbi:MAG: M1 family metallopeptidase, partial [Burkholderiaceae bacterium]|nr:M1 family metallopeptidase [Burkholderiaceae bacterium]
LRVQPGKLLQSWRLTPTDESAFEAGDYVLRIEYSGKVQNTGSGLFRVPYAVRGQPEVMLATQLEAVFARMVFPCFDEPAFRAVFEISVTAPSAYAVHSNMPPAARPAPSARINGHTEHRFAPTPSMPTYLVAVTVGRFGTLKGEAAGVPLHIYTAPGKQEQASYAMEVTKKVVPFFTEYFGVPYSLPKLDQLAVPGIRDGAMEDWGLISYSEDNILFNPARSGFNARREVFNVVAHEIAHQWFGNLVTAASWEEIWLNEAFATWMETKASERFNPEWNERLRRRPWLNRTMAGDSGSATRAIRAGGVTESNVFDVFDPITYDKGGAVLAMLEQWIGEKVFRQGLAQYMKERQFSNATAGDLWHHMQVASGKNVSDVAASWTEQQGFPVVHLTAGCSDGRTIVQLRQSRFSLGLQSLPSQLWKIPISLTRGKEQLSLLLEQPNGTTMFTGCSDAPVLANGDGLGFYRVSYDSSTLQRLTESFARLTPDQQSVLLSDTFALAQAGQATMSQYFDLIAAIPSAMGAGRSALFSLAIDHLKFLATATAGTPAHERVRVAARALLAPELARIGWDPRRTDSADTSSLRNNLIARLAYFGDAAVINR